MKTDAFGLPPNFHYYFYSQLQMEQKEREMETQELVKKLNSVQAETKSLFLEKNDLVAENKALEAELEMAQKTKRFTLVWFLCFCLPFAASQKGSFW